MAGRDRRLGAGRDVRAAFGGGDLMAFRVGQKVVCISAEGFIDLGEIFPVVREIYTIREIKDYHDGICGLRLAEIVNKPKFYRGGVTECWFASNRFRPLVERTTDISIFTAMLKPSKVDA